MLMLSAGYPYPLALKPHRCLQKLCLQWNSSIQRQWVWLRSERNQTRFDTVTSDEVRSARLPITIQMKHWSPTKAGKIIKCSRWMFAMGQSSCHPSQRKSKSGRGVTWDILAFCRMKALARGYVWWPKMDGDSEQKVRQSSPRQENRKSPT